MFKRSDKHLISQHFITVLVLTLAFLEVIVAPTNAQQAIVRIDTLSGQALGQNVLVDIILEPTDSVFSPSSFHLVIGYDQNCAQMDYVRRCPQRLLLEHKYVQRAEY